MFTDRPTMPFSVRLLTASWAVVVLIQFATCPLWAADKKPDAPPAGKTKKPAARDVLARCKAATALVEVSDFASGTAFCVSKSGLFVTNAHVVASIEPGDQVRLILASGTKTERSVMARLVAVNEESDLALMPVPAGETFVALSLGDDSKLTETMEVTALGYPFGKLLSDRSGNPAVSVNKGRISAVRTTSSGRIDRIQMDVPLNPGNSGGPIVNSAGKVIGIAVAIMPRTGISFAVPVSLLREFMKTPSLLMQCPAQAYFSSDRPPAIEIEVEQFTPKPAELVIQARFPGSSDPRRVYTATGQDDRFQIQPEGFSPATQPRLRLTALSAKARIVFDVEERKTLRLGAREFQLADLKRVEPRGKQSLVTTLDGERYAGKLTGLELLPWPARGPKVGEFAVIDIAAYDVDEDRFRYHILARDGEEEVAHLSGRLKLLGVPATVDSAVRQDTLAYWRFEDGVPGTAVALTPIIQMLHDSSGNGNHLRTYNAGTAPSFSPLVPADKIPASGKPNRTSLDNSELPGEGNPTRDLYPVPSLGPGPSLQQAKLESWTIEASVRFTNLTAHPVQTFLSNAGSNYPQGEPKAYNVLFCSAANHLNAVAHTKAGKAVEITNTSLVQHNQWYHLALVSDQKMLKFYLSVGDDKGYVLVGESPFDGALYFTGDLWLIGRGGWDNRPSDQFMGQIDEVRISTAALAPNEFLFAPAKSAK